MTSQPPAAQAPTAELPVVTRIPGVMQLPPRSAPPGTAVGRHAAAGPVDPRRELALAPGPQPAPTVRRWANWFLLIPLVVPLLSPLYNRRDPELWGVPFFFWFQISCAFLACTVTTLVYLLTKGRR